MRWSEWFVIYFCTVYQCLYVNVAKISLRKRLKRAAFASFGLISFGNCEAWITTRPLTCQCLTAVVLTHVAVVLTHVALTAGAAFYSDYHMGFDRGHWLHIVSSPMFHLFLALKCFWYVLERFLCILLSFLHRFFIMHIAIMLCTFCRYVCLPFLHWNHTF